MRSTTAMGLALAVLALTACGSEDSPDTPVACVGTAADYIDALAAAPEEVLLAGSTPISDCLVTAQESGALATAGQAMIDAASRLNEDARRDPGGEAAIQLGYLSGAVDVAAESTGGIHEDLRLRLASAARFAPGGDPLPAGFERGFAEGYAAGRASE